MSEGIWLSYVPVILLIAFIGVWAALGSSRNAKKRQHSRVTPAPDRSLCMKCGKERHRKDKITVLAWAHDSCEFPEGIPLPDPLAEFMSRGEL